jgi:hypothetical protein
MGLMLKKRMSFKGICCCAVQENFSLNNLFSHKRKIYLNLRKVGVIEDRLRNHQNVFLMMEA